MSASTIVLPETAGNPRTGRDWRGHALQLVELVLSLAWIAGAVRYWHQGGGYAAALLSAALILLLPRQIVLISALLKGKNASWPPIWILLPAVFLPEHLTSGGAVVAPHLVPLLLASICLLSEFFADAAVSAERWISLKHRAAQLVTIFAVVYYMLTTILAIAKLRAFGYIGQDIGYFMQCLFTGLHGELFSSNQYHDLLYTRTVSSDFASHNQPVLFLLLPIYWLHPHAETLFIVRNLCMAASAYPAYQLARCRLQSVPSAALVIAFLLAPSILFQNFYDYAPLSLIALPLLFALLFFERRQFLPYIASLLLCLFVREDLVLVLLGLAVAALIARRDRKWILVPAVIGLTWGLLYLIPLFQHGAVSAVESCFSYLGATPGVMIRNIFLHPGLFLTHKAIVYTKQLLTPFGMVLGFFSPVSIAAIPLYLINLLGDPGCNAAIIFRHYSLIPSVLLFPGVVAFTQPAIFHGQSPTHYRKGTVALAVLLASIGTTWLSVGSAELTWWRGAGWNQEARQVAASIPPAAAVAVPRYMLPLTANRPLVYQTLRLLDYHHPDAQYVVVDRDDERMGVTATWDAHYRELLSQLADPARFQKIYSSPAFEVYQLIGAPLRSLRPVPEER